MTIDTTPPLSPVGFEGFEKRLEITFSEPPFSNPANGLDLRALTRSQINSILEPAFCTIVDQLSNSEFDSYVLSESSLFIYPLKIILKTCGTTKLLCSIVPLLELADSLTLSVTDVKYSRGSFIFPDYQPLPHRNFAEEVAILNKFFGHLNAAVHVLGDPNHRWHIYSASKEPKPKMGNDQIDVVTLEMCMTGLDRQKAAIFYKKSEEHSAKEMTISSGISEIIPTHVICDHSFDPCGYSMNGIEGASLSSVHVTPEEGFSYASYEAVGFDFTEVKLKTMVKRALKCFGPKEFSVAVTCRSGGAQLWAVETPDVMEYTCKSVVKQELPGGECLVYKTYRQVENKGSDYTKMGTRTERLLKLAAEKEDPADGWWWRWWLIAVVVPWWFIIVFFLFNDGAANQSVSFLQ
ncbi:hypothetical protein K2173_016278 [Erythroxylum novogranatense]|uniref:adenosylmethionine decarboxylase n=1 Tax=Erythroxylum novogranatense TaxID=1862640 RepID=A0AAV8SFY0_9ROSI|nr:hypothetical protein K2173_016278 [Erythroxylum novogranatense]